MEYTVHLSSSAVVGYLFLSALWLLISGAIMYSLYYGWSVRRWLAGGEALSHTVDGEVISFRRLDGSASVCYAFCDSRGKKILSSMNADTLFAAGVPVGEKVNITFCKQRPSLNYIEPYRDHYLRSTVGSWWFLCLMLGFMLLLAVRCVA